MNKKWYVLLVLALFLIQGVLINAADEPPKKVAKLIKKAEKALKKQELDKALESYNKAKELAPEYGPIYQGIARVQVAQKMYDEAVANMENAIKYDSENAQLKEQVAKTFLQLAKQAMGQRDFKKANDYFIRITKIPAIETLDPKLYPEVLFHLGTNYATMRKNKESNDYLNKILAISGIETADEKLVFQVYYKIGLNHYNNKKFVDANTYFEKLINMANAQTIDPKFYATTHYLVGLNSSQLKDYKKSTQFLNKFIELNKDETIANPQLSPLAHFLIGTNEMTLLDTEVQKIRDDKEKKKKERIATLAKQHESIITHLTTALTAKPELEPAYMHMGNFYYYSGDKAKAIEMYKKLIEKFPVSPDIATYKQFLSDLEKPEAKKGKKK